MASGVHAAERAAFFQQYEEYMKLDIKTRAVIGSVFYTIPDVAKKFFNIFPCRERRMLGSCSSLCSFCQRTTPCLAEAGRRCRICGSTIGAIGGWVSRRVPPTLLSLQRIARRRAGVYVFRSVTHTVLACVIMSAYERQAMRRVACAGAARRGFVSLSITIHPAL